MHESRDCDIYLHVSGRPIIEDCTGVRFAPLPQTHANTDIVALDNQWAAVDDFKWLRSEPSPNWSPLEETERLPGKLWEDVVPGGPGLGTEDILKAAKVLK